MKIAEVELSYKPKVKASDREKISDSSSAHKILKPFYENFMEHREVAFAILLNRGNKVLGVFKLSEGGVSSTVIDAKILYQAAVLANASAIILSHNHPSGELRPSEADRRLTKDIIDAGKLFDIEVLDHLIVTEEAYISMADECLM